MIRIQCTSCKKTLEADEKTLSEREASVVRCPSCGVTLLVDRRKASVVGPDVRVAADDYKPPVPRPVDELKNTAPASTHIALIADLYEIAEAHLHIKNDIRERTSRLTALASGGREALDGLRVAMPPRSSDSVVCAVSAAPDESRLDEQLATLSKYLQDSRKIADGAGDIWRDITAPHRYEPIVEWKKEARAVVANAYVAIAGRAQDSEPHIARLQNMRLKFERLVKQYRSEQTAREDAVTAANSRIAALDGEHTAAQSRLVSLEQVAEQKAYDALKGGGCASVVVSGFIAVVIAASTNSAGAGWIAFFAGIAAGLWLAWQIGFNSNKSQRAQTENTLSEIRSKRAAADRELREAGKLLDLHIAATPDVAPPATTWSLLTSPDFDPETAPRAAVEPDRPHVSVPTPLLSPAAASAVQGVGIAAGVTQARPVGFIPQMPVASTATAGTVIPAPPATEDEPPAEAFAVPPAARSKRRIFAIIGASSAVILVLSYFIWSSTFSFGARINKALAAGQIFAPAGASVYDLYKSEIAKNPRSRVLAEITPKIRARLAPAVDDTFTRWYRDSDNTVNWEEMEHTCEFLALLEPGERLHRMRQLYAIAQQSIDSRNYARAISSYEEALRLDPSWALALNGIGKVYMIETSPLFKEKIGVAYYQRAAAADTQFTWAPKNLGDYAIRKRDYTAAERYLQQALASSPQRPSILRALGLVCRKTGRGAEAIRYYEQSLLFEKDPEKTAAAMKAIAAIRSGAG